jgi:hypothetical protein
MGIRRLFGNVAKTCTGSLLYSIGRYASGSVSLHVPTIVLGKHQPRNWGTDLNILTPPFVSPMFIYSLKHHHGYWFSKTVAET